MTLASLQSWQGPLQLQAVPGQGRGTDYNFPGCSASPPSHMVLLL